MKRAFVVLLMLAVVAGGCNSSGEGGSASAQAGSDGSSGLPTARQAVEIADGATGDFSNDAFLVKVSTYPSQNVHADGTAWDWKVTYWSPSDREQFDVFVRNGELYQTLTGTQSMDQPGIGGEWVDSPQAIEAMAEHCSTVPDGSFFLMLYGRDTGPEWGVTCGEDDGEYSGRIDAVSGDLISAWPGNWDDEPHTGG